MCIYTQLDRACGVFPVYLESVEHVSAVICHRLCFKPASGVAAQLGQFLLFPDFPFCHLGSVDWKVAPPSVVSV